MVLIPRIRPAPKLRLQRGLGPRKTGIAWQIFLRVHTQTPAFANLSLPKIHPLSDPPIPTKYLPNAYPNYSLIIPSKSPPYPP